MKCPFGFFGSRREQVGLLTTLCFSISLTNCFNGWTTLSPINPIDPIDPIDPISDQCSLGTKGDLRRPLNNLTDVIDLVKRLAGILGPLLRDIRPRATHLSYVQPDTCLFTHPMEVIRKNGFEVTKEKIETDDGFILTAWRVRSKTYDPKKEPKKYPVLLQHGIFCSGADWLYMSEEAVLPYVLANEGYEVWIGNARGTQYSQEHKNLETHNPNISSSQFWEHRMKVVSKKNKVNYVGYSMGTTMFFIYASEKETRRHYEKNVNRFVGLAPAMYIHRFASQFRILGFLFGSDVFHGLLLTVGKLAEKNYDGPLKYDDLMKTLFKVTNILVPYLTPVVKAVLDTSLLKPLVQRDRLIKNLEAFTRAMGHFPENISLRTVRHYVQFFAKKVFGRFDYTDAYMNQKMYGSVLPPRYLVGDVKVPSLFIGGEQDSLVVPADAEYTKEEIKKCSRGPCATVEYTRVPCFTHLDFIWGPNNATKVLVHNQILRWMNNTWDESLWPDLKIDLKEDPDYCMNKYFTNATVPISRTQFT